MFIDYYLKGGKNRLARDFKSKHKIQAQLKVKLEPVEEARVVERVPINLPKSTIPPSQQVPEPKPPSHEIPATIPQTSHDDDQNAMLLMLCGKSETMETNLGNKISKLDSQLKQIQNNMYGQNNKVNNLQKAEKEKKENKEKVSSVSDKQKRK